MTTCTSDNWWNCGGQGLKPSRSPIQPSTQVIGNTRLRPVNFSDVPFLLRFAQQTCRRIASPHLNTPERLHIPGLIKSWQMWIIHLNIFKVGIQAWVLMMQMGKKGARHLYWVSSLGLEGKTGQQEFLALIDKPALTTIYKRHSQA